MNAQCALCGKVVVIDDVPEDTPAAYKKALLNIAKSVVHESCAKQGDLRRRMMEADQLARIAMESLPILIPSDYANTVVAQLPNQEAHAEAMQWKVGAGMGLLMYGPTGHGKTRTAYMLLKREHLEGSKCLAYTHTGFALEIARCGDRRDVARFVELCRICDVLLLDDLGQTKFITAEGQSTQISEFLFEALEYRISNGYPTIVTTQLTGRDISERWGDYGKSFARRLREKFNCVAF